MFVWGVSLRLAAVAELAGCLTRAGHDELALRVGFAVDNNRAKIALTADEREQILDTLEDCPERLTELRDVLRAA
jgi:hypothetical protein